jgi:UDP:flavonoid glycosyltransferase YjiC (YdhE family)
VKILVVTWDGGGNVPPALGIAAELAGRGHQLRVMGHPVQEEAVVRQGLPFVPYRTARAFRGIDKQGVPDYIALFGDRAMGRDVMAELEREAADVVVVDCMMFGPLEALHAAGQRYVVLEHLFDEYFTRKWLRGPIGLGLAVKRFRARRLLDGAAARLVATLPELDPASSRTPPANRRYSGPVVAGIPSTLSGKKVLVSLSTFNFPGLADALQRIIDALGTLDVRAVVTTGPVVDPATLRVPANVEVHRFVPHGELLPEMSLVVGHGGHATTMAALAHDVPLLILPMHPLLDQPMVGRAVQDAGAGSTLPKKAKPAAIAEAVTRLVADGPHREAAARLGAAVRAMDGRAAAATEIEALLRGAPASGSAH